jgi:nucleoside-diphosphate-sugar epimerase
MNGVRIFLAGASGVIGRRLVPLLLASGHHVTGTTRRALRADELAGMGATPVVVDVLDAPALARAVADARPDVVVHQLTDLSAKDYAANGRLRIEGTRNLVTAATDAGVGTMIAQSIAWLYGAGGAPAVEREPLDPELPATRAVSALEQAVGEMERGVVLRYGRLYGPGTWYGYDGEAADEARAGLLKTTPAWTSFVHVDDAAAAAAAALEWPAGPVNVVDDDPATVREWLPAFCDAVGAPPPPDDPAAGPSGRPISNARARSLGWRPRHRSWRTGFATLRPAAARGRAGGGER